MLRASKDNMEELNNNSKPQADILTTTLRTDQANMEWMIMRAFRLWQIRWDSGQRLAGRQKVLVVPNSEEIKELQRKWSTLSMRNFKVICAIKTIA